MLNFKWFTDETSDSRVLQWKLKMAILNLE